MRLQKSALLALGLGGLFMTGCAVTNYESSSRPVDIIKMSAANKYNVVSSETVYLKAFDENGKLPSVELAFMNEALRNHSGSMYGDVWKKMLPQLEDAYGYLNIHTDDTADMKISTRSSNPIVFDDSAGTVPVNVKTVVVLSPEVFSAGWTTSYALTLSMSPMKKYNYGALLVAVTDGSGKTIGTRVIGLYRTQWFSALLPTALFAIDSPSADGAFFRDMTADEKAMQISIVVQAVSEILCTGPDAAADSKWWNIRGAVVESLAVGDVDSAVKLLKAARDQKFGGNELSGYLSLLGI